MQPYATSNTYDLIRGGARAMRGGSYATTSVVELINLKRGFLTKIFATLITQLGITYYVMTNYDRSKDTAGMVPRTWVLVLLSFGLIVLMAFVPMNLYAKFGLFTAFSGVIGLLFSSLMRVVDPVLIKTAVLGTLGIFTGFFLLGAMLLLSGITLGVKTGMLLLLSLLTLIIASVVMIFTGQHTRYMRGISVVGLVLFSIYIAYDTNRILQKDYYGDFVTASLDYYLDIINIFIRLLNFNHN